MTTMSYLLIQGQLIILLQLFIHPFHQQYVWFIRTVAPESSPHLFWFMLHFML